MEEPRQVPDLVHVLRHSFRPSDTLGNTLENFLPPESKRLSSSMEIKSLGMLALDGYLHANYKYSSQLIEARKAIEKSQNQSMAIIPDIKIRRVSDEVIDVLMGVENRMAMYLLTRTTRDSFTEAIPLRDKADTKFSVYARIRSSVPITDDFQHQAVEQYNEAYQEYAPRHLMNIVPEGIIGKTQHVPLRRATSRDDTA